MYDINGFVLSKLDIGASKARFYNKYEPKHIYIFHSCDEKYNNLTYLTEEEVINKITQYVCSEYSSEIKAIYKIINLSKPIELQEIDFQLKIELFDKK